MINIYNVDFFEPLESHITFVIKIKKIISNNICIVKLVSAYYQFGSMPVLEEAKTMVYVTNHNMITMAMVIFKTYKMADKGEERVLTEILVYSCFIEPFICLLLTMNWEVP